jgi:hypothetical protein
MFKQLKVYYFFISLPYVLLLGGAAIFADGIKYTIIRNPHPQINYTIFTIILVGGILILLNSKRLMGEVKTILAFFAEVRARKSWDSLQDLANTYRGETACLLQMVASSGGRSISHQEQVAIENELTNTRSSMLRRNALPSYLTGLLVGMGLLGTFIGLLATLNDISVLISSFADLDMQNASPLLVFRTMIERMKAPMQSMGIAFSASMFGLLGSIIMGLMMVGLRRLQGDMFSVLSSEVARHIEIALAQETVTFGSDAIEGTEGLSGDVAKVLFRIEERYAEAARSQQRSLSTLTDDVQKQRADLLRVLSEQTEANNNIRGELQQVVRQLGGIFSVMEKGNEDVSNQLSELTIHMSGDARENNKLLAMQVEEQKSLREALDSYRIEERLAEAARSQQRALSTVIDDFQSQRNEMLQALTAQTEAGNSSRSELQKLGGQLESILGSIEKGNVETSTQISELTVLMAAEAKEAQLLQNTSSSSFLSELQQLGSQLETGIGTMETSNSKVSEGIADLTDRMASDAQKVHEQLVSCDQNLKNGLHQLGAQLIDNASDLNKGTNEVGSKIAALTEHLSEDAKTTHNQLEALNTGFSNEVQQLGGQLGTLANVMKWGNDKVSDKIGELTSRFPADEEDTTEEEPISVSEDEQEY